MAGNIIRAEARYTQALKDAAFEVRFALIDYIFARPELKNTDFLSFQWKKEFKKREIIPISYDGYRAFITGRVACKQMIPKDERRSIEEGRERENLTSQLRWALLFTGKRGFLPELQGRQGKFWPGTRNIIRAKARYITPPLHLPHLLTPPNVRFFRVKISENHTSRISLSRGGSLKNQRWNLRLCAISLLCCVYVWVRECGYSALLVTPWPRGMALYYHLFAPFHGSKLLALHVLSHVILSDVSRVRVPRDWARV